MRCACPKNSDEEKELRNQAIQEATKKAILVPLTTMKLSKEAVLIAEKVAAIGNSNALSDAGVAAINANAAAKAAYLNVKINMSGIEDKNFVSETIAEAEKIFNEVNEISLSVEQKVIGSI